MIKILSISICIVISGIKSQPDKLSWKVLQKIDYEEKYFEEAKGYFLFPKFSSAVKSLEGKMVTIEGFVIPVEASGTKIALSANPYASCFFCGRSGPASIMTVKLKKPNTKFKIDDFEAFSGTLRLNADNIREFYYILEDAEQTRR